MDEFDVAANAFCEGRQTTPPQARDLLEELHREECAHGATLRKVDLQLVAAFKRGVQFRETVNAPVPSDAEILEKLEGR